MNRDAVAISTLGLLFVPFKISSFASRLVLAIHRNTCLVDEAPCAVERETYTVNKAPCLI